MRLFSPYKLILISFFLISCSDTIENNENDFDFIFPLSVENYWTYNVEFENRTSRDSLFIDNEVIISNSLYKEFKTKDDIASGFYSSSLRNNKIKEINGKLTLSGNLVVSTNQLLSFPLTLSLNDFIIFDKNAQNNRSLNSTPHTGIVYETVNGYPLTIHYSLQSFGGESFLNYLTPDGNSYSDVKSTQIKLNLTITTEIEVLGSSQMITALSPQDVLVSKLYLANGIGVVHSHTITSYTVNNFIANELSIEETNSQTQDEFLDLYELN